MKNKTKNYDDKFSIFVLIIYKICKSCKNKRRIKTGFKNSSISGNLQAFSFYFELGHRIERAE